MSTLLGRGLLASLALFLSFPLSSPCLARADLRIEIESFINYNDLGGGLIQRAQCSGALNGWVADFVDLPGEFVEVGLVLDEPMCFVDSLRSAGSLGEVRRIATSFRILPAGTEVSADTVDTLPGSGIS